VTAISAGCLDEDRPDFVDDPKIFDEEEDEKEQRKDLPYQPTEPG
jgi:hypothetical protein